MSFLTGRVSFTRFALNGESPKMFDQEHLDRLADRSAGRQKIASADGVETGWTAGSSILDTEFTLEKQILNDALLFELRVDTDKPPADLLKAYYEVELRALAKGNPSGLPSARQKREAKETARDRLEHEAKDGRFRKRKCTPVLWDRTTNEVLFGATSLTQVDRFMGLFEQTFGMGLTIRTAGVMSQLNGPHAYARFQGERAGMVAEPTPSAFIPGVTPPDVAWIADEENRDWLGNEFLLWLWYTTDYISDTLNCDGGEIAVMFSGGLAVECPRGQTGRDTFATEGPTKLPEARRAIQAGKLPRKAGLILVRHNDQFDLVLSAETLAVSSARLPPPGDDVTDHRARLEHRVTAVRDLITSIDAMYGLFLEARLTKGWPEVLKGMQGWLKGVKVEPKPATNGEVDATRFFNIPGVKVSMKMSDKTEAAPCP